MFSPHYKRYSHQLLAASRSCAIFEKKVEEISNEKDVLVRNCILYNYYHSFCFFLFVAISPLHPFHIKANHDLIFNFTKFISLLISNIYPLESNFLLFLIEDLIDSFLNLTVLASKDDEDCQTRQKIFG